MNVETEDVVVAKLWESPYYAEEPGLDSMWNGKHNSRIWNRIAWSDYIACLFLSFLIFWKTSFAVRWGIGNGMRKMPKYLRQGGHVLMLKYSQETVKTWTKTVTLGLEEENRFKFLKSCYQHLLVSDLVR